MIKGEKPVLSKDIAEESVKLAYQEIDQFGLPTRIHFDLSLKKGIELAEALGANVDLVRTGIAFMDVKLGEAFRTGRLGEHVAMGIATAREFLSANGVDGSIAECVVNCVEAHHGAVPFNCVESEIVTNADCYRFLHPIGVIHYIGTLSGRGLSLDKVVDQAEAKLDEKHALLSLELAKGELLPFYGAFKNLFHAAREMAM